MSRFIAIANQKGGVGKTTTTVNLAASLAELGQNVLVVDMDPQGNASSGLGVAANTLNRGVYEVLMGSAHIEEAIYREASPGVDLLPSGQRLIGAEVELVSALARERILEKAIQPIRYQYDILLADCPPSLGLLTVNTLTAADTVLIPIQCEYYALEGVTQLMNAIRLIQQALNPRLELEGILLTMFDARLNLSREVVEEARKFFEGKVYETVIPRNVRLSEAPSFGKPVLQYDPECSGAQFYLKLAREVLKLPLSDPTPVYAAPEDSEVEAEDHSAVATSEEIVAGKEVVDATTDTEVIATAPEHVALSTSEDAVAATANEPISADPEEVLAEAPGVTISSAPEEVPAEAPEVTISSAPEEIPAETPGVTISSAPEEVPAEAPVAAISSAPEEVLAETPEASIPSGLEEIPTEAVVMTVSPIPEEIPAETPPVSEVPEEAISVAAEETGFAQEEAVDLPDDIIVLPEDAIITRLDADSPLDARSTPGLETPDLIVQEARDPEHATEPPIATEAHPQEELVSHD